ncbi:hypothetical protein E2C01_099112 [Portunus trituberculatus]|uniref:Uncharacterized protein n=1 Tax=Portunus trituberculatus TaxID=210409 RepID=A0A5B7JZG4_PORTR|nr:hypothetical protein [Portunus trituberculatus]
MFNTTITATTTTTTTTTTAAAASITPLSNDILRVLLLVALRGGGMGEKDGASPQGERVMHRPDISYAAKGLAS